MSVKTKIESAHVHDRQSVSQAGGLSAVARVRRVRRWLTLASALIFPLTVAWAAPVQYTYDSADRLVAVDYGGGKVTLFTYDQNGNRINRATVIATNADVRVTKSSSSPNPNVGVVFSYTLTATNAGPNPATGVTLSDTVPFGTYLHSVSPSQGSAVVSGRSMTCSLGVLPVGVGVTVTLSVRHGFVGSFTNVATIAANKADPNLANNFATNITTAALPGFGFDSDNDGMPGWWEALNISSGAPFTDFGVNGPNGHADTDGVRNFDEWIADTRANDANSFFAVSNVNLSPGGVNLTFPTSAIRRYVGQFSDSLGTPFMGFVTNDGTGMTMTITDTNAPPDTRFYRVEVQVPAP